MEFEAEAGEAAGEEDKVEAEVLTPADLIKVQQTNRYANPGITPESSSTSNPGQTRACCASSGEENGRWPGHPIDVFAHGN